MWARDTTKGSRSGRAWLLAGLTTCAVLLAACGSSGNESRSTRAGDANDTKAATISLAVPAVNSAFAWPYLADSLGYFKDADVQVKFTNGVGTNALNLVSTKRVDLTMFGAALAFPPVTQGRSTTIIYNQSGGGIAGDVAVKDSSAIRGLAGLAGKRVGVLGTTGSGHAFAQLYARELKEQTGSTFEIKPFGDASTLSASLTSGAVDAVVGNAGQFTSGLESGDFRLIVDMADEKVRQQRVGGYFAETAIFGLTENLKEKRTAVTRFLKAIDRANTWMHEHTPAQIAQQLRESQPFKATSQESLARDAESAYPFMTPNRGRITPDLWDASLKQYALYDIPDVDVTDQKFSYRERVDMSYLTEAIGE